MRGATLIDAFTGERLEPDKKEELEYREFRWLQKKITDIKKNKKFYY